MSESDRDRLSARVRVLEAREHLERARRTLAGEDDELADALDDVLRRVDAVSDALATADGTSDETAARRTANRAHRRRN